MTAAPERNSEERPRALLFHAAAAAVALALATLSGTGPAVADPPLLGLPVDCTLGRNCYIQQYFDRDPAEGSVADHGCGSLANDGHGGTDFAVATMTQVRAGVPVIAAAPGVVLGLRDGMPDVSSLDAEAPDLEGRDCGNGVVLDHGDGWLTQYCHMREGSIAVQEGQRVAMGARLGLVGMSGRASFPHLHLSVFEGTQKVDPFAPANGPMPVCDAPEQAGRHPDEERSTLTASAGWAAPGGRVGLWLDPPAYVPGGLLAVGFADRVPTISEVRAGLPTLETVAPLDPAMVVWGFAFAGQSGDEIEIIFEGPEGEIGRHVDRLEKSQPFVLRAYGKRTPEAGWPRGAYRGTVLHRRGAQELGRRYIATTVE